MCHLSEGFRYSFKTLRTTTSQRAEPTCRSSLSSSKLLFLIIDLSLLSCFLYLVAVLGSFFGGLNKIIADRYSWNHTVSEYHVYEFFRC
ncbi:hypothetical protein PVAP13_9KG513026 [Panicum virgatum]|uniref:Uncharacterized protein n=1 Tax=Panicum virgatum TaxID=38727 RepID=A0A8T0NUX7_PANVG|nr:hypothetical protein PVAP13_9KG513026 [Panicum virgatum]